MHVLRATLVYLGQLRPFNLRTVNGKQLVHRCPTLSTWGPIVREINLEPSVHFVPLQVTDGRLLTPELYQSSTHCTLCDRLHVCGLTFAQHYLSPQRILETFGFPMHQLWPATKNWSLNSLRICPCVVDPFARQLVSWPRIAMENPTYASNPALQAVQQTQEPQIQEHQVQKYRVQAINRATHITCHQCPRTHSRAGSLPPR